MSFQRSISDFVVGQGLAASTPRVTSQQPLVGLASQVITGVPTRIIPFELGGTDPGAENVYPPPVDTSVDSLMFYLRARLAQLRLDSALMLMAPESRQIVRRQNNKGVPGARR